MFATKQKPVRGNKYCQGVARHKGYVDMCPMKYQNEFDTALQRFCKEIGAPVNITVDGFITQKKPSIKLFCDQVELDHNIPWENISELHAGLLKEAVRKYMRDSDSPMVLWEYSIERRSFIHNSFPLPPF